MIKYEELQAGLIAARVKVWLYFRMCPIVLLGDGLSAPLFRFSCWAFLLPLLQFCHLVPTYLFLAVSNRYRLKTLYNRIAYISDSTR